MMAITRNECVCGGKLDRVTVILDFGKFGFGCLSSVDLALARCHCHYCLLSLSFVLFFIVRKYSIVVMGRNVELWTNARLRSSVTA